MPGRVKKSAVQPSYKRTKGGFKRGGQFGILAALASSLLPALLGKGRKRAVRTGGVLTGGFRRIA